MTGNIFRFRWHLAIWGVLGVAVFSLAMMTLYGLEPRHAGYMAGGLLITCLAAWVAAFFLGYDHRGELDFPRRVPAHIQWPGS